MWYWVLCFFHILVMYIKFQLIFRRNHNIRTVLTFTNHFNCSLYSNGLTHPFTVQRKVYSQLQKFVPNVRKNISLCPRGGFRGETDVTSLSTFLDNLVMVLSIMKIVEGVLCVGKRRLKEMSSWSWSRWCKYSTTLQRKIANQAQYPEIIPSLSKRKSYRLLSIINRLFRSRMEWSWKHKNSCINLT